MSSDVQEVQGGPHNLWGASKTGSKVIVQQLLVQGAHVNKGDKVSVVHCNYDTHPILWPLDDLNRTGVTWSTKPGSQHSLVAHCTFQDGRTPLYWASRNGHKDVTKLLLDRGPDVNIADRVGMLALSL